MEAIKIVINSKEDAESGKPIAEQVTKENMIEAKSLTVGILEGKTVRGQTTLMFILENPDETNSISQMTGNQLEMLIEAYKSADVRFNP